MGQVEGMEKIDEETNWNQLELGPGNYQHGCRVVEKNQTSECLIFSF